MTLINLKKLKKNFHKQKFYISNGLLDLIPSSVFQSRFKAILRDLDQYDLDYINTRVNYYNKLTESFSNAPNAKKLANLKRNHQESSAYYYDLKMVTRYFNQDLSLEYLFADVTHIPERPTIVKSRPIDGDNQNSVLLKLDSVRHYYVEPDPYKFEDKINNAVWRGVAHQSWRREFLEQLYHHPRCDVGDTDRKKRHTHLTKDYLTIQEQLQYKYIVSMEGVDVATNLKWIMQSNSLCLMKKPLFETWFMEGTLQPGVHYVELKEDHSDLIEKMNYYDQNPEEAKVIIQNAQTFAKQFYNKHQERLISILVLKKYLELAQPG